MCSTTSDILRTVKQDLRTMMNGVTSHSMREKGLTYKVNFGVELPRLQSYAEELGTRTEGTSHYALALALWNEPIRECRLLAGLLMPPTEIDSQTAEMWVEQMMFQEEAECTVMHLFQHMPDASSLAFRWIAHEEPMYRQCGWLLMARLFMQGLEPSQRDADELLDQLRAELSQQTAITPTAYKALLKYMDLSTTASVRGEELLAALQLA